MKGFRLYGYTNSKIVKNLVFRLHASICIARISYGNVSVCLSVCHSRYCIKTSRLNLSENFIDRLIAPS